METTNKNLLTILTEQIKLQEFERPFRYKNGQENAKAKKIEYCNETKYKTLSREEIEVLISIYNCMRANPEITDEEWAVFMRANKNMFAFVFKYENNKKYNRFPFNLLDFLEDLRSNGGVAAGHSLDLYELEDAMDKEGDRLAKEKPKIDARFYKLQEKFKRQREEQERRLREGVQTPLWEQDVEY